MKSFKTPLLLGLVLGCAAPVASAQSAGNMATTPLTRAQVVMERNEFMRTHKYDSDHETWVLKPGFEAPASMKTRAQVRAERDEFFKNNRYDEDHDRWVSMKGEPKSTLTREQAKAEYAAFTRTHTWDSDREAWVDKKASTARK